MDETVGHGVDVASKIWSSPCALSPTQLEQLLHKPNESIIISGNRVSGLTMITKSFYCVHMEFRARVNIDFRGSNQS